MGNQHIRMPQQQRSIDKRNRIIDAGYQLFCEKGYYKTNTAEIAKLAGVSTGILYNYFKDKKDIFMYVIEVYEDNIAMPIYNMIRLMPTPINQENAIRQTIFALVETHFAKKSVHEGMYALSHSDQDIKILFYHVQSKIANQIVELMEEMGIHTTNAFEKAHIIMNMIENISFEFVYQHHEYLNYDAMVDIAVKTIIGMLHEVS